jgi:hypothetical protein
VRQRACACVSHVATFVSRTQHAVIGVETSGISNQYIQHSSTTYGLGYGRGWHIAHAKSNTSDGCIVTLESDKIQDVNSEEQSSQIVNVVVHIACCGFNSQQ